MMRVIGALCLVGGFASVAMADPVYPGDAAAASTTLSSVLTSATSSSAYRQSICDESANMNKAIAAATSRLSEAVASEMSLDALRKDAFITAHVAARKLLHVGGCARDYSGCPAGFTESAGGCAPGSTYGGFCGAFNPSGMSTAAKNDWAWKCGASWACA